MSLGSRVLRRGGPKVVVSSGLPFNFREPLLFLYPQWIRATSTTGRVLDISIENKTSPVELNTLTNSPPGLGFHSLSWNIDLQSSKSAKASEKAKESTPKAQKSYKVSAHPTVNKTEDREPQTRPSFRDGILASKELEVGRGKNTVYPTGQIRRILSMEEKRITRRNYEKETREAYEEIKMRERLTGDIDWREILATLERRTPNGASHLHDNVLRIKVPSKAVGRLLYGEEDNIWAIKMRCGCQIEVLETKDESEEHRVLLISGQAQNISKAGEEILQIAPGAISDEVNWSPRTYASSTKSPQPHPRSSADMKVTYVTRYVRADRRQSMATPIRADKIPRPSIWTPESFGYYVQHLTSVEMTVQMQRTLYQPGEYHKEVVVDILKALFTDPKCRKAISVSAFNNALAYLEKQSAIGAVKDLFVFMEMENLKMNTETFNIMLRGTARSRSLGNFHHIFLLMLRRGYTPNADTWIAFLRVVDDFGIKSHILQSMKSKELLHDHRTQKQVCETFVEMEIYNSLDNHLSQEKFLEHMANHYGREWLSKACASRILDALGSRGLISRCWDFIEHMNIQNVKPCEVDILTILRHCEKQRNPEAAIEVMRRISLLVNLDASQDVYCTLFSIAWTNFLPCMARIVWSYACLNGSTTPVMRRRVFFGALRGLSSHIPTTGVNSYKKWREIGSLFVLGLGNPYLKVKTTAQSWDFNVVVPTVPPRTPDLALTTDPSEAARKAVVKKALSEQMEAYKFWTERVQFTDLLIEAFKTDQEWTTSGVRCGQSCLAWLAENSPTVPLRWLAKSRTAAVKVNTK